MKNSLSGVLGFDELFDVEHEDRGSADTDFQGEGRITSQVIGRGGRNDFGAGLAFLLDEFDGRLDFIVFGTDDQGGVADAQEAAGGGELGDGESVFGERGLDGVVVFIRNDSEDEFHGTDLL